MNRSTTLRRWAPCFSATALAVLSLGAAAQTQLERVEIVGSNIKRIDAEGPSPVQVIKRADIEATGATNVFEALMTMTSVTSGFNNDTSASFAPGAASVSLRGLSERNVLVLMNGRRLANFGFAQGTDSTFVDLNSLPLSAIEEVQILRDGASAIYGSDAVAGVINFVTKRNYTGIELGGRLSANDAGDEVTKALNMSAGFGELHKDGFNLLATLDLYSRGERIAGMHALTKSNDLRPYGGYDGRGVSEGPGSYVLAKTYRYAMPGCPASQVEVDERGDEYCRTDVKSDAALTPKLQRTSAALVGNVRLGTQATGFTELSINRNVTDWQGGYQGIEYYVADRDINQVNKVAGSPYFGKPMAAYRPDLGCFPGAGCFDLIPLRLVYEAPHARNKAVSDTTRLLVGVRGSVGELDWETAAAHARNKVSHQQFNMLKRDAVTKALNEGGYDPFAMWNPDSVVKPLLTDVERVSTSKLSTWDAKLSHPELFTLGGPVGMAAGVQLMHESIADVPDAQVQARNIENWGGTSVSGSRKVRSGYVEFSLQPIKTLEVQLALRGDNYSDFGTTYNPKLAVSFRPMASLMLRGGYNTAFKAPTLPQLYMNDTVSYSAGVADWLRCKPLGLGPESCRYTPKLLQKANPDLNPEKTKITSLGVVYNPTRQLYTSLDYYYIDQRDTIQLLNDQYLMDNEFTIPGFDKLVIRDPRNPVLEQRYPGLQHGRLNTLIVPFMNVGRIKTSGADASVRWTMNLAGGRLTVRDELNYQFSYKQSDVQGKPLTERLDGLYRPTWRNALTVGYDRSSFGISVRANTAAGTLDIGDPANRRADVPVGRVPSFTTYDLNLRYSGFRSTVLNVGMLNVTDKAPRFSSGLGSFLDSLTGASVYASLRHTFR